jgi:cytochrome c-type biogenesis protein
LSDELSLAFTAGSLAAINPCGLVLLPGVLAVTAAEDLENAGLAVRLAHALRVGTVLSLAFTVTLGGVALSVSIGLRGVVDVVPWLAVAMGVLLVGLGVAIGLGRSLEAPALSRLRTRLHAMRRGRLWAAGVSFAIASVSCSLGVFLALVGQALSTSEAVQVIKILPAFGAGAASVLLTVVFACAIAQGPTAALTRAAAGPLAPRLGGLLLIASGAYLLAYWLPAVLGDRPEGWAADLASSLSSSASEFISTHGGLILLMLALFIAVGTVARAVVLRRSSQPMRR